MVQFSAGELTVLAKQSPLKAHSHPSVREAIIPVGLSRMAQSRAGAGTMMVRQRPLMATSPR